jgi:hypothetical protein
MHLDRLMKACGAGSGRQGRAIEISTPVSDHAVVIHPGAERTMSHS